MDIKTKALLVIEGLTSEGISMPPEKMLGEIYRFAHIARGECGNPHEGWAEELTEAYTALKKHGVI